MIRQPVPFQCKCGAFLGTDTGRTLVVGPTIFARTVTLTCYRCSAMLVWAPAPAPKVEPEGIDSKTHGL